MNHHFIPPNMVSFTVVPEVFFFFIFTARDKAVVPEVEPLHGSNLREKYM